MLVEQTIIVRNMKMFVQGEQLEDYGGWFSGSGVQFSPLNCTYS